MLGVLLLIMNPQITMPFICNIPISIYAFANHPKWATHQSEDNTEVGPRQLAHSSTVIMVHQSHADNYDSDGSKDVVQQRRDLFVLSNGSATERLGCVGRSWGNVSPGSNSSKFTGGLLIQ